MKHILSLVIFAFFALGITSCDSENPSSGSNTNDTNSTKKELEIISSKTSLGIYETFNVRARMSNTPLSDIIVRYDFGDGTALQNANAGQDIDHAYLNTGTFTLTAKAIDIFTRDTIATKTLQMVVNDVIPVVAFNRDVIDTVLFISGYNVELDAISFTFTTNANIRKVRYQFGDGVTLIDSTPSYSTSYSYRSPGTYKVILDAYNDKGNYWASDTMMVTIRLQEPTFDMLTGAYNVSVMFAVDSTASIYPKIKSYGATDAGIGTKNDATPDLTWTGNSFDAETVYASQKYLHFTGAISTDLKKLETMTVSILDSAYAGEESKLGYRLFNLDYMGMNNDVVIYRAAYRELSSFASDMYLSGSAGSVRRVGNGSTTIYHIQDQNTPSPYAYVIFTRK